MSKLSNKTLILDIDECLLCSFTEKSSLTGLKKVMQPENVKHRGKLVGVNVVIDGYEDSDFYSIKRPHLDIFLRFADLYFEKIIIWSAAMPDYVHKCVSELFRDHRKPVLVLTQTEVKYESKDDYHKPISVIMDKYPGLIDPKLTLFVDDKADNFRNNKNNGLHIPKYSPDGDNVFNHKDDCLFNLMYWLSTDEVVNCDDVTKLDKKKAFKTPPKGEADRFRAKLNKMPRTHCMLFSPMSF